VREGEEESMPRVKNSATEAIGTNGFAGEVFTLADAAAYLRLSEGCVLRLVKEQGLPARQFANEWRFLKSAIQDWLRTGSTAESNKEAWRALAGRWKDDPVVDDDLREIHRRRHGQQDGSHSRSL
jgi:excisionase family DNA binding protein